MSATEGSGPSCVISASTSVIKRCRRDAARDADRERRQHAVADRFAVAELFVFRDRLERVADGVAEVEGPAQA